MSVRIGLTGYGMPQVLIYPLATVAAMLSCYLFRDLVAPEWGFWVVEAVLAVIFVWMLSFFRDPKRKCPEGKDILVSPADGLVTDVTVLEKCEFHHGKTLRIGIFLSIFNVHINRVPCAVRIDKLTYKKGKFKNAMSAQSSKVNESNDILMTRLDEPVSELMVRQVSGAIARNIVCPIEVGEEFAGGEKFGMIKFGSRTELFVPLCEGATCLIKKGNKVRAGVTVVLRYENEQN